MGIYDRDYMKRRPEDDDYRRANSDSSGARLDAFFDRFLKRNPRFFIYLVAALAIFIIIGLVAGDPKQ